ncbi:MAG: A/G-specific adenine glycosylase [Bacteroidetes bacterium]|nr:MAG: A/G-specific adenine glycosylase [Bacteroidota bacterium]MBL1143938.1 A/G-specific adenine glycosylase [Bacteroidota bacterium]NOG56739.1 A/G-specific adenine glycosylase [Bacteroidota bacterium]
MRDFSPKIQYWYDQNKRDLPWRKTRNPYKIWLSEIILQQTRVDQGMNYYLKFISKYPTIADLAMSTEDEILKDWQGLGYYSRARNLLEASKMLIKEYQGNFPSTFNEIKKLKGVGEYTAAAIASFAFGEAQAVVDGNVYRVLSRYFGIQTAIDSTKGKKEFQHLANQLLDFKNPANHNQAIMEFGALQCTPKNPDCANCPLEKKCIAKQQNLVHILPYKAGKTKQRNRFFNYLILYSEDELFLNQRKGKGIWQNLYEFPLIETEAEVSSKELLHNAQFKTLLNGINYQLKSTSKPIKHILSHQIIFAKFYHLRIISSKPKLEKEFLKIKSSNITKFAVPKLIENYVREETNLLSLFQ